MSTKPWATPLERVLAELDSGPNGIGETEAEARRRATGPNVLEGGASRAGLGFRRLVIAPAGPAVGATVSFAAMSGKDPVS